MFVGYESMHTVRKEFVFSHLAAWCTTVIQVNDGLSLSNAGTVTIVETSVSTESAKSYLWIQYNEEGKSYKYR